MTKTNNTTCYVEDGFLTERDHNEEVLQSVRLSDIVSVRRNDYRVVNGITYGYSSGEGERLHTSLPWIHSTRVSYSNGSYNDYPIDATDLHNHLVAYRAN
jgi:hypothetical protein